MGEGGGGGLNHLKIVMLGNCNIFAIYKHVNIISCVVSKYCYLLLGVNVFLNFKTNYSECFTVVFYLLIPCD